MSLICRSPQNQSGLTADPRIAVIGDVMIDFDLHCSCTRICQEGPWPVLVIEREERRWGGAGNVAEMVSSLGPLTLLLGLVGSQESLPVGSFQSAFIEKPGATTSKSRIWCDGRMIGPRIDRELLETTLLSDVEEMLRRLRRFDPAAIIVADHGKGVVTVELMNAVSSLQVPVFVDPIASTPPPGSAAAAIVAGRHELPSWADCECTIIKSAADGLRWFGAAEGVLPSSCQNLVDPLGAGDQFIAALAFQRSRGWGWSESIRWASLAAGIQCERRGCVPVTVQEVEERLESLRLANRAA
jgi:D-beta-D-heptose 7-phosphate kinase/D-beta-D-heptose 1-phosphate adenosyltransferase